MILYFTGTGNSRHAARRIAKYTGDTAVAIMEKIKTGDNDPIEVNGSLVVVTPTYAWRIPRLVERWLRQVELQGAERVWFVMTCGSEIGSAARYNRRLCKAIGLRYMGTAGVVMPENYIAMFDVPDNAACRSIVEGAEPLLEKLSESITAEKAFDASHSSIRGSILSGVINGPFYRFFVKSKEFAVDDTCIRCGMCAGRCPTNCIHLENDRPVWGEGCTHCMACICYCPTASIEYGTESVGKPRYHLN